MMHDGLAAYLDTLLPGEGLRVFQEQPPLGGRKCNLRAVRRPQVPARVEEVSDCSASTSRIPGKSFLGARLTQKLLPAVGDDDLAELIPCSSASTLIDAQPLRKPASVTGDDDISSEGESVSTACGSDKAASFHELSGLASCSSAGSFVEAPANTSNKEA